MKTNFKSNTTNANAKDKKPGFIARLKSKVNTAPKADKHAVNRKLSGIYLSIMFLLLGLGAWAATMLVGLVGATLTHTLIAIVKAFGKTFDMIFDYKVILLTLAIGAVVFLLLFIKQQKRRIYHEERYGKINKKTKHSWKFTWMPAILGLATVAGILVVGLVGTLLYQGIAVTVVDFMGLAAKVWNPMVAGAVAACCAILTVALWWKSITAKWRKDAKKAAGK